MAYDEEKKKKKSGQLEQLQKFAELDNIADELDDELLLEIGNDVVEQYEEDEDSRAEWLKRNKKAIECAKQTVEEKSFPWPNASNVRYPLVTSAAIHFNSRAMPAIVSNEKVVKGRVVGKDPNGEKTAQAERIGDHMSFQLLEEMSGWEEDTDKLLTILPIAGNVFRKTYYCPLEKENISNIVRVENFVYNYTSTFEKAPRHTEIIPEVYAQDIVERQRAGIWSDVELDISEDEEDEPQEFLEQHKRLDLDGDGYKEPYIVTVHRESKRVVRIFARFDVSDITVKYDGVIGTVKEFRERHRREMLQNIAMVEQYQIEAQSMRQQGITPPPMQQLPSPSPFDFDIKKAEIVRITPVEYYTKYGFIPAFDGGGYDIGLGELLGPLGDAINSNINQLIDAGTASNLQGGFISKGLRVQKGKLQVSPLEWKTVENPTGATIRDSVMPFNFKGPNAVLFNLLSFLIDAAKDISSVKDTITGETVGANESPTTYVSRVSEGLKVFSAIYKRVHRSLKQELKKLHRLNRLYLPDEDYYTVLDDPRAIKKKDYDDDSIDVIPVSDPAIATTTQKTAKTNAMYQAGKGNPHYDQYKLEKIYLEAIEVEGIDDILIEEPPQPPPDPKIFEIQAKIEKMGAETEKIKAETVKTYNDIDAKVASIQQEMQRQGIEIRKHGDEMFKFFEKMDLERFSAQMGLLEKIVPDQKNLETYRQAKEEIGDE